MSDTEKDFTEEERRAIVAAVLGTIADEPEDTDDLPVWAKLPDHDTPAHSEPEKSDESGDEFVMYYDTLKKYNAPDGATEAVIPDGTLTIGERAFMGCTSVCRVVIPASVKYIMPEAFKDCTALTDIAIPDTVDEIWDEALHGTPWLKNQKSLYVIAGNGILLKYQSRERKNTVTIPSGVRIIYSDAFKKIDCIHILEIPDSVIHIQHGAFSMYGCKNLERICLSENVGIIGAAISRNEDLRELVVGGDRTEFEPDFCDCFKNTANLTVFAVADCPAARYAEVHGIKLEILDELPRVTREKKEAAERAKREEKERKRNEERENARREAERNAEARRKREAEAKKMAIIDELSDERDALIAKRDEQNALLAQTGKKRLRGNAKREAEDAIIELNLEVSKAERKIAEMYNE